MMNWLKKLMPLILVDLLKEHKMILKPMRLKANYLGLATTSTLNGVINNITKVYDPVKKIHYNVKIEVIEGKYCPHLIIINVRMKYLMIR